MPFIDASSLSTLKDTQMELLKEMLSSDVGIMSLVTIVVASLVVGYAVAFFIRKANEAPPPSEDNKK